MGILVNCVTAGDYKGADIKAKGMRSAFYDSNGTSMVSDMKLRDLLAYGKISDDELKALDNQLRQISVN